MWHINISLYSHGGKSLLLLYIKNSNFFLSYFSKKDEWSKAHAGSKLPTLPYLAHVCLVQS